MVNTITCSVKLRGQYKVKVFTEDACTYETPWFDNLITNSGLDQIAISDYASWCSLGIGITPVYETDLSLASFLISSNTIIETIVGTNTFERKFDFTRGSVVGTLTEVGIGWNTEGTPLFSRSLLPSNIPVTDEQQVQVLYRLTIVPPTEDFVYNITLTGNGGEITNCRSRAAFVGNLVEWAWGVDATKIQFKQGETLGMPCIFDGPIALSHSSPAGNVAIASRITYYDYVLGTYYLEMLGFWNLNKGNFTSDEEVGGVRSALFLTNGYGAFQILFTPSIQKTCYHELKLLFKIVWGRLV